VPALSDGEVTALVARRGQDERVAVHIDGHRAFDISAVVADRAGLRAGVHLSAERQLELLDQDAPFRARERALRLLGLRDRSRRELETRLRQAGFDAEVVCATVEWLAGLGYLDDGRFARAYAAEKQRSGWGPRRVRAELAAKGVERSIVEETMASAGEEEFEEGAAEGESVLEHTIRKRFGRQFAADPVTAERRLAGFLARRGYGWETTNRMVRMLRSQTPEDS
jgi:regulatory protein